MLVERGLWGEDQEGGEVEVHGVGGGAQALHHLQEGGVGGGGGVAGLHPPLLPQHSLHLIHGGLQGVHPGVPAGGVNTIDTFFLREQYFVKSSSPTISFTLELGGRRASTVNAQRVHNVPKVQKLVP